MIGFQDSQRRSSHLTKISRLFIWYGRKVKDEHQLDAGDDDVGRRDLDVETASIDAIDVGKRHEPTDLQVALRMQRENMFYLRNEEEYGF